MITKCCICHNNATVHDRIYMEPLSKDDFTSMFTRGYMCNSCEQEHSAIDPKLLIQDLEPMTEY